jgi:hypothetical protein
MAQSPTSLFQNQQQTSGVVGVASGQTARLNVLYPTAPAPILQISCSATLGIADDQGTFIKSENLPQFSAGKSFSINVNADTDLAGVVRTEIHGSVVSPNGCSFIVTLELIDNATQKTLLVVGSTQTYPVRFSPVSSRMVEPGNHP